MINIKYRLPKAIYEQVLKDLARPHAYAAERIGFLFTRSKKLSNGSILITAIDYVPVDESSYINDEHVGARINSDAILMGMQRARSQKCGVFHVHKHDHKGKPSMSWIDEDGIPPVVESFSHVSANQCHGIIILSKNSLLVNVLPPDETNYIQPSVISIVGYPNRYFFLDRKSSRSYDIYIRQEFLGPDAQYSFENIRVGIVGYGGGGSHVGQQLAHIGVTNQVIFDDDQIEDSNLNRLIGGRKVDLANSTPKTDIAGVQSKIFCLTPKS